MSTLVRLAVLASIVVLPTGGYQNSNRHGSKRNKAPTIQSFTSSTSVIHFCPFSLSDWCSSSTIVALDVRASDPEHDSLSYNYQVSKGVIVGEGPNVNWDLARAFGPQTATVEVTDQRGAKVSSSVEVNMEECSVCDPPCPTLSVSCPATVTEGETAIFEASISSPEELKFLWSHSNGQRIPGQQGAKLRIKAVGSPGDVITAAVRVLGIDPACSYQASCETRIEKQIR